MSGFEVSAPFDLGASIYDDIDPILAVLNNMIERGLPTRTSPFIEDAFSPLGNHKVDDGFGGLNYNMEGLEANDIMLALHAIDGRLSLDDKSYRTKVLESDFEKRFIFNSAPAYLRQILMPQRSLMSITGQKAHHSQRVDFACEFPYPSRGLDGREKHGLVIELDGTQYHNDDQTKTVDNLRTFALEKSGWYCLRLRDLNDFDPDHVLFNNEYFTNAKKAFDKKFDTSWVNALQFTLSPIGIARIQKTLIEALISGKINYKKETLSILAIERDVPCVALALKDFVISLNRLASLSEEYKDVHFPRIVLDVISSTEFIKSPLHLPDLKDDYISINVIDGIEEANHAKQYDTVFDVALMRRSMMEEHSFSSFHCKNNCYFFIRSANYLHADRHIYTSDCIT